MAAQFHFQFPSDSEALRFARSVVWTFADVAIYRRGVWVSVIDGVGGRDQQLLAMAIRIQDDRLIEQ